jgi:antitoxin VapB
MHLNESDEEVDRLAETLASLARVSKAEAVRMALANELQRRQASRPLRERIKPIQDRIASYPSTGLEADKAYFDELNGDS